MSVGMLPSSRRIIRDQEAKALHSVLDRWMCAQKAPSRERPHNLQRTGNVQSHKRSFDRTVGGTIGEKLALLAKGDSRQYCGNVSKK